jgi:hypothetical protein
MAFATYCVAARSRSLSGLKRTSIRWLSSMRRSKMTQFGPGHGFAQPLTTQKLRRHVAVAEQRLERQEIVFYEQHQIGLARRIDANEPKRTKCRKPTLSTQPLVSGLIYETRQSSCCRSNRNDNEATKLLLTAISGLPPGLPATCNETRIVYFIRRKGHA